MREELEQDAALLHDQRVWPIASEPRGRLPATQPRGGAETLVGAAVLLTALVLDALRESIRRGDGTRL